MCGLAGIFNLYESKEISLDTLKQMIAIVKHRGPDGFGLYKDDKAALAHARLSIIDLEGGQQPIHNEDKTVWITFNGEIFNYLELRELLIQRGHKFYTHSDTEVIIHLYEDYGTECLSHLNGQFAFAIWDKNEQSLFLARDRVGIRPLFYTKVDNCLLFGSEIKSIFMDKRVRRELDPLALDQIFTYWMSISPRTPFKHISELPAGHFMMIKHGEITIKKYWDLDFTPPNVRRTEREYAEELKELLIDSTRLQLRADVPVGAYLSGGIDSSVITSLIKNYSNNHLRTFSVSFTDKVYDESSYQREMIDYLQTDHSDIQCTYSDIGKAFPDVIWHTEKPILRTAPTPLFLLSKLVRKNGYKVVLTGEGADEMLAGYDIFKEAKVRRFIEKFPDSNIRPLILKQLYPYLANSPVKSLQYARKFFNIERNGYPSCCHSHIPRWNTTSRIKHFFSDHLKNSLCNNHNMDELSNSLDDKMAGFDPMSQSQYLEIKTLLSGYLLSSQGDRVAMANSIEGRYPFLDHRVMEFCSKLPPNIRMKTLTEKYILKKSMPGLLPASIINRTKQPYMSPDSKSFFYDNPPGYLEEILSPKNIEESGYFNPKSVSILKKKCKNSEILGFKDNMAIVGIISTLLLQQMFVDEFETKSQNAISNTMENRDYAVTIGD